MANPLLLYFLETTVRVMAEATGGSPYYIRNRIREALVASDLGAADGAEREVTLTPFAADPNRRADGRVRRPEPSGCASIPGAPARILELSADTAARRRGLS